MDTHILLRQLLRQPHTARTLLSSATRPQPHTFALLSPKHSYARHLSVPTILRPAFWKSMIPRPLRSGESLSSTSDVPSRQWNPATPYIVLALLVGSQAIQILWLKQERALMTRRAEAKMGILREVVERVQRGEEVDVEGILGTGVEGREREWAGLLKEIEDEELLFQSTAEKRKLKEAAEAEARDEAAQSAGDAHNSPEEAKLKVESLGGAKFY
ncbi:hypothetical protein DPSP01_001379 [Paraphaeosphaeria sporulosa]|uniref:Uncharacterized protein n=1 Tax=Paraphaeosphaeria sporulosa TaxID=1460663 RepID=A0A177CHX7_9PLEO|nr:uncharacterized protein CC84DRAFT_1116890 [Paraphaeosphaeria sporulosa]OAG06916.1 hypothetical protein CC84DRAFT_1116890 [Paraphaeosphaeria sporulosa]